MKLNVAKYGVSRFGIPNLSDEGSTLIVSLFGQNNKLVGKDMTLYACNKPWNHLIIGL